MMISHDDTGMFPVKDTCPICGIEFEVSEEMAQASVVDAMYIRQISLKEYQKEESFFCSKECSDKDRGDR